MTLNITFKITVYFILCLFSYGYLHLVIFSSPHLSMCNDYMTLYCIQNHCLCYFLLCCVSFSSSYLHPVLFPHLNSRCVNNRMDLNITFKITLCCFVVLWLLLFILFFFTSGSLHLLFLLHLNSLCANNHMTLNVIFKITLIITSKITAYLHCCVVIFVTSSPLHVVFLKVWFTYLQVFVSISLTRSNVSISCKGWQGCSLCNLIVTWSNGGRIPLPLFTDADVGRG